MQKTLLALGVASAALIPILSGCGMAQKRRTAAPEPVQPRDAVLVFGPQGERVAWGTMLETARHADVVFIGETHGHPLGLAAAASLWEDLVAAESDAALLMEFFERDEQVALDDYLSGITDEEAFREAAGRTDGNYPAGHARMIELSRSAGRPVFAANAPRRYVRKTSPEGFETLEALGEEQRRLFAVPDRLVEGRYRDDFFALMGGADHGESGEGGTMPPEMIEKIYRSQQLWDSTMADSVVRALERGHRPVVLVVGRFHTDFDGGTVQFVDRRRPGTEWCTLSMVESDEPELAEEDLGRADFVVHVGPGPEHP
ncbi:ChaN family lipoprotein [bacterium]|nr:ChaN family lipoprotein [bacterium]